MINQERLLRTFLDLVKINSPSKYERGVADYLKPRLEELGFEVKEDNAGEKIGGNAGNIIATLKGSLDTGSRLFFSAHMDTVDSTEGLDPLVTEDGVIHSGGKSILGADDKAGIAATLEAAQTAIEKQIPFNSIQLCYSIAEEIGLLGAATMDPKDIKADVGYIFDTGKPVAGVVISAPSHENFVVKIFGKAAHAGIDPENGISAIITASNAISRMKLGRIDHETTANVGVIRGGKARNIIPDEVEIRAEARSRNDESLKAQVAHMIETFEEAARETGAAIEIDVKREYTTYRWTAEDPPVKLAQKAAMAIGLEGDLVEGGGGSDANIFNNKGVPAVVIGVGYEGAHAKGEKIAIEDLNKSAEFVLSLIKESAKD